MGTILSIADLGQEREKRMVRENLASFFISRFQQTELYFLENVLGLSLMHGDLTESQAQNIVTYLSKKFGVRNSEVEHYRKPFPRKTDGNKTPVNKQGKESPQDDDLYMDLFLSFQKAAQEKLMEFYDALRIIATILDYHPKTSLDFV